MAKVDVVKMKLLSIVKAARSDALERAESLFRGCTQEQLDGKHGASTKTRREILEGYRKEREEWKAVYEFVKSL